MFSTPSEFVITQKVVEMFEPKKEPALTDESEPKEQTNEINVNNTTTENTAQIKQEASPENAPAEEK